MEHSAAELIARLEAAEVGSRELDVRMVAACDPSEWGVGDLEIALEDPDRRLNPQHYTTSLDAALALAKSVLPSETMWNISHLAVIGGKDFYFCDLYLPETGPEIDTSGDGWSPSLAVCAAILRALDAQEQK